jgi:putative membrane protein insertion efficiency factor
MCNKKENVNLKNLPQYIFIFPIKIYQIVLSPWLGSNCRHQPTCSNYAIQSILEWGIIKGFYLGIKRILKLF